MVQRMLEKWSSQVSVVTIGATGDDGGTRTSVVRVGGESTLPFLLDEGDMPHPPVVAMEVCDMPPEAFNDVYKKALGDVINDPAAWAQKCEKEWGAEAILLKLASAHPDAKDTSVDDTLKTVDAVRKATGLPLIIMGTGHTEKDNQLLPECTDALKGEKALFAAATQDNYKRLAAACIAGGHSIIAESPLDINICKQVNVLLGEIDMPSDRVVIYTTNGALGYGFEYAYSILERTRIAGLSGDRTMAMPVIVFVGSECIRAKEAKAPQTERPEWGADFERAVGWEITTAVGYLNAGADICTLFHPEAVRVTKAYIDQMMTK
jgi:acetyl-CoA decarbonylase/synthase complex subunit delta